MDYAEMKDKLRREGMAEQKAKFMSTAGTPAQTSMRYGSMTDAEEKANAAKPAPMFESAQPSQAKAPTATVRGVPEEMTAEYYAPANKAASAPAETDSPSPAEAAASRLRPPAETDSPSPAEAAASRLRRARDTLGEMDDIKSFYRAAGTGVGMAIGAGLGGPPGALGGAGIGAMAGDFIGAGPAGDINVGKWTTNRPLSEYEVAERELAAAQRAIAAGLRDGTFTKEEVEAAIKQSRLKK